MWKIRILLSTILVCAVVSMNLYSRAGAQSVDPTSWPLVEFNDLEYLGGFRLPAAEVNGDSFSAGGDPIAFNPAANSLFIGTRAGRLAEVSIPTPLPSTDATAMPFAVLLQPFTDPTEGHLSEVGPEFIALDGLMVHNNRLIGTASNGYDANNTQQISHYSRSLQLDQPSFSGWSRVWEAGKTGFVTGFMSLVPAEWQSRLGGPAITGQCCLSNIWRTSYGPSSFAFDPAEVGQATVDATAHVYYDNDHKTLGSWEETGDAFGTTTQISGVAIIAGTRTALFFGRNGLGQPCYGNGTSNQSLHGTYGSDGAMWCYDPSSSDKGQHAFPYRYQIWAYDLNDFAAVRNGTKQPWEVVPYGVWPFELPTAQPEFRLGGVGYDSERQLLYISQVKADQDGYGYRPVIHALHVAVGSAPSTVSAVALAADKAAPQSMNTAITFTATPTGGVAPHQYKWFVHDGSAWTVLADWASSNQFSWSPTSANTDFQIRVWARSSGSLTDTAEATASMPFAISGSSGPVTSVSISPDKAAPQLVGTSVVWTAAASGGSAPLVYKWWIYDDVTWTPAGGWSSSNGFTWTPSTPNVNYRLTVWVKHASNGAEEPEANAAAQIFAINAPSNSPVDTVSIAPDQAAPQPVGTSIVWTATPSGGTAPFLYKWWTYDDVSWTAAGDWTSSNTFTWTPSTPDGNYRVTVWVKRANNSGDEPEASAPSQPFAITPGSQ